MPGMGVEMDGAVQQAPQWARHFMVPMLSLLFGVPVLAWRLVGLACSTNPSWRNGYGLCCDGCFVESGPSCCTLKLLM
jgi:hypothetical protein